MAERERAEAAETLRREQEAAEEAKRRDMEAVRRRLRHTPASSPARCHEG